MPTPRTLYLNKLNTIAGRYGNLEDVTVKRALAMLREVQRQIAAELGQAAGFDAMRLGDLQRAIARHVAQFEAQLGLEMRTLVPQVSSLGGLSVVEPMSAAGIAGVFHQPNKAQVSVLVDYSADLVKGITAELNRKVTAQVRLAALGQVTPLDAMKGITQAMGVTTRGPVKGIGYNAERILRTELQRAYNLAHHSQQVATAKTMPDLLKRWVATADHRTRGGHLRIHNETRIKPIPVDKPFKVYDIDKKGRVKGSANLMYPGDPSVAPQYTVNCLLPGNEVVAMGIQAAMRSFYDGPALEIRITSGKLISVTPNHPVLTPDGFIAAKLLSEGDNVISTASNEKMTQTIDANNYNVPTLVEEIWRAYSIIRTEKAIRGATRVTSANFHGDGRFIDGNINVIWPNGLLMDDIRNASLLQKLYQKMLRWRGILQYVLACRSPLAQLGKRALCSPNGIMSGDRQFQPFLSSKPLHSQAIGGTNPPRLDTSLKQVPAERRPRHTYFSRKLLLGFTREIAIEKVVKVSNIDFRGHVYDLQTIRGLYTSNGIVVKNCRCRSVTIHPAIGAVGSSLDGRIAKEIKRRG